MTQADFSAKWDIRFKDNTDFLIDEQDLREFKDDCLLVFGAGATAGISAQQLGIDPATGELLVLLSPSAPTTVASYVLVEYTAGTGTGTGTGPGTGTGTGPGTGNNYVAAGYVTAGYVS
jgi:hypothetical protein